MTCAGRKPAHFSFTKSLLLIVVLAIVNMYAKPFSLLLFVWCERIFRKIAAKAEAEETNIINQHLAIPTRERALQNSCKEKDKEPCWLHLISARLKKVCKQSSPLLKKDFARVQKKDTDFFSKLFCRFGARVKIIFHPAIFCVREEVYFHYIKN